MMFNQKDIEEFKPKLNTLKIIAAALPIGCIVMLLTMAISKSSPYFLTELTMYGLIGIVFAAGCYMASFIVPLVSQKNSVQTIAKEVGDKGKGEKIDNLILGKMFGLFQNSLIIRYALLEGAMFFNIMLWFLDGNAFSLIAVAVGLILMLMYFPTESRIISKVEEMATEIERGNGMMA